MGQKVVAIRLASLDAAHRQGAMDQATFYLGQPLLRADATELDAADRESLVLLAAACDGSLAWNELADRLKKVEPALVRQTREAAAFRATLKKERAQQVADLLAEAKANDTPAHAAQALDALARLLRFDPKYVEAGQLKAKIEAYNPRKTITNSLGMKLIEVRPGRFWMGNPLNEDGRNPDEHLHSVRLTKTCFLAAHEVTRGQFSQFVEE